MAARLAGKIAIVTGGASGIGKATCIKFANEGAQVVLVDINKEGLNEVYESLADNEKHFQVCGDVSDSKFIDGLFDNIARKYGKPATVLVNCAGILLTPAKFYLSTEEKFDKIMSVNLKSVFLMSKAFVNQLKSEDEMKNASIVNVSSIAGKVGDAYVSEYSTSKAGMIGATKSMGKELGAQGIRCNAVLPGNIETPMADKFIAGLNITQERLDNHIQTIPLKRRGKPEESANVILFLASEESSFVTCACYEVTGGWQA